ncbi:MAG: iron-sulfur cluster assembly protein, partial [Candidatus Dormiibacterota bacterium]
MSTTEPVSTTEAAAPKEAKASDALIRAALSEVYDPEIGIDIVSLGLIYGTAIDDDGLLTIDMTLT